MKLEVKSPISVAVALAVFNYLWYLALSRTYILVGHTYERAVVLSFVTWILCLPFTFWLPYYFSMEKLRSRGE
ncbi:MAG: hypothetical protein GXO66_01665 [Euryarchaeota archaeon]|nr:hypothetical protein [Euryarchaeota archaeon]